MRVGGTGPEVLVIVGETVGVFVGWFGSVVGETVGVFVGRLGSVVAVGVLVDAGVTGPPEMRMLTLFEVAEPIALEALAVFVTMVPLGTSPRTCT